MKNYFEIIANYRGWLEKSPKKSEVIANAKKPGFASILPNTNNRALVIDTENIIYLQSYDTIVLTYDWKNHKIKKIWDGYSKTTLKHINIFLSNIGISSFNKKSWLNFSEMYI